MTLRKKNGLLIYALAASKLVVRSISPRFTQLRVQNNNTDNSRNCSQRWLWSLSPCRPWRSACVRSRRRRAHRCGRGSICRPSGRTLAPCSTGCRSTCSVRSGMLRRCPAPDRRPATPRSASGRSTGSGDSSFRFCRSRKSFSLSELFAAFVVP